MFQGMKMLATKIKLNIKYARDIHRTAQHLIKMFPVMYSNTPNFGHGNKKLKSLAKLYPGWSRQYPIVIYTGSVEVIGMAPLQMEGYNKTVPGRLVMANNGHTISISLIQDNKNPQCNSCRPPTISGGLLTNEYEFEGLHFHWTKKNNRGCEHVIDNIRYRLEMHLVHRNIKYDCTEKALEHEDGLCVAAVFFNISEMPCKAFNRIIDNFIYVQSTNTNITLDCGLVLEKLLPANIQNFYTYKGSSLSQPYNKSINWIIFPQPIYISFDQWSEFLLLQKNQDNEKFDNCRNIQPIENKKIYARDPNIPFIPVCDVPCPNVPITTNVDVNYPHVPTTTYNNMYLPFSPNEGPTSNIANKELFHHTWPKKELHNSTTTYNYMYFPIPPKNESESTEKIEPNSTSTNKVAFNPILTKEAHQNFIATYNYMYFPIPPKNESESTKKIEPNSTSTNKEASNPILTKEAHQNFIATYNKMYFPIPPKNESESTEKLEPNSISTNEEAFNPILTKEEHQNSIATYNKKYLPISPKDESESPEKIEPNSTSTNKEAYEPTLTKGEHCHSTATFNEVHSPILPKNEIVPTKKIEPNPASLYKKALNLNLTKEEHQRSTAANIKKKKIISSENENSLNKKIKPSKEVVESTLTEKDATVNKKEFCNPITTNVLSSKTQDHGFMDSIRNMIKYALIKFFSK